MATNFEMIDVPELSGTPGLQWSRAEQTSTGDTITTILHGKADYGVLFDNVLFDALREERVGTYGWYAGHNVRHGYGRQYDEVDLTAIELNVKFTNGYYSRFEATARTESRPLEEKRQKIIATPGAADETYETWWNHRVVSTTEGESITTADWKAMETTLLPTAYAGTTARWVKSNQALKKGEFTILEARFPGVQSYGVGALQVKEIIYARTEQIVQNQVAAVGYLASPIDSAGNYYDEDRFGTDATKWLVTSASYRKRLGWYEAEMTYAYAKGGWLAVDAVGDYTGVYPKWSDA